MNGRFQDKVALVTGAAGGIGQAIVDRFSREGASLVLMDRDAAALRVQADALAAGALPLACDIADADQVNLAMSAALQRFGRIDFAVLNAGIEGRVAELEDLVLDDFDRVMAINVRGVFLCLSRLMAEMKARRAGVVTIIASTGGQWGSIGMAPYVASKHAVLGLMKCAALEGAEAQVRVNAVSPGPTETRMMRSIELARGVGAQAARARSEASIPLKRLGRPDEVAAMVAFLCSEEATYATGGNYLLDGGLLAGRSR